MKTFLNRRPKETIIGGEIECNVIAELYPWTAKLRGNSWTSLALAYKRDGVFTYLENAVEESPVPFLAKPTSLEMVKFKRKEFRVKDLIYGLRFVDTSFKFDVENEDDMKVLEHLKGNRDLNYLIPIYEAIGTSLKLYSEDLEKVINNRLDDQSIQLSNEVNLKDYMF